MLLGFLIRSVEHIRVISLYISEKRMGQQYYILLFAEELKQFLPIMGSILTLETGFTWEEETKMLPILSSAITLCFMLAWRMKQCYHVLLIIFFFEMDLLWNYNGQKTIDNSLKRCHFSPFWSISLMPS